MCRAEYQPGFEQTLYTMPNLEEMIVTGSASKSFQTWWYDIRELFMIPLIYCTLKESIVTSVAILLTQPLFISAD